MKLKNLLLGDIKFQIKYGFYFLYLIFTIFYIVILSLLPSSWVETVAWLLIYTDPTTIGLIFMGAIIQLELAEKTFDSLVISPITPTKYLLSKTFSLGILSYLVSVILGLYSKSINNFFTFSLGILLGASIFSCLGMILAFKAKSLNQFILFMIPFMIVIIFPGIIYLFDCDYLWLLLHPGIAIIHLLAKTNHLWLAFISAASWSLFIAIMTLQTIKKNFNHGGKLNREKNHEIV